MIDPLERLQQQIDFLIETDKLKTVLRATGLIAEDARRENSAEHSWTLALMAVVLAEHANEKIDVAKTVKMCLLHDLVEIYTGDTIVYDQAGRERQAALERELAPKFFGKLPAEQAEELLALWREFEAKTTPEAKFAAALDRLAPLMVNYRRGGGTWTKFNITREQVLTRNRPIGDGGENLWNFALTMIDDATARGLLK